MTMEMIEVEAFVTIARLGSFTRAAEVLFVTQPAISRRVEVLERELGAPLFERFHGGARLTEAGRAFLPFAEQIVAAARDGARAVRATDEEERGTVTLALVGTLASTDLTRLLQRFRESHPQIRVVLHTGRSTEVSDMVRRGEVDLGLRYFADPQPDIVSDQVYEEPLVVIAARDRGPAPSGAHEPQALAGVPWVSFPAAPGASGEPYGRLIQRQLQQSGLGDAEVVTIDSLTAQKRLVEAGFGVAMVPESSVQEELRLGTLRALDIPALRTSLPVVLIRRRRGYLSLAARRLLAEITGA